MRYKIDFRTDSVSKGDDDERCKISQLMNIVNNGII